MIRKRYSKYLNPAQALGDLLGLNIAFLLAYLIKFSEISGVFQQPYLQLLIYLNLSWIVLVLFYRPYRFSRLTRVFEVIKSHLSLIIIHLLLLSAYLIININSVVVYSRLQILITYILFATFVIFWKFGFNFYLKVYRSKGGNFRNVAIVGYGDLAQDLTKFFQKHTEYGFRMLGFISKQETEKDFIGFINNIDELILNKEIDQVYVCLPYLSHQEVRNVISKCESSGVNVKLITDFRGFSAKGLELERFDHIPIINVTAVPLDITKNKVFKRVFDITFSLMVFVFIFSWLFPLISLWIKLDSRGPIFFRQLRTGKDNQDFWCWKFRTMYVNGEANMKQATKGDSRITKVGAFLRKTSVDELPQFINVLLGDMSIIGPRPHMLKHTEEYSSLIDNFMQRHVIKPGITGLAQAKGFRGETQTIFQMAGRVRLDRFYIENWSMLLDVKILLLTIMSIMQGDENAY
jgi:putative colanic acid biosysnthesis UDP-glucose lipid carrier transferase